MGASRSVGGFWQIWGSRGGEVDRFIGGWKVQRGLVGLQGGCPSRGEGVRGLNTVQSWGEGVGKGKSQSWYKRMGFPSPKAAL